MIEDSSNETLKEETTSQKEDSQQHMPLQQQEAEESKLKTIVADFFRSVDIEAALRAQAKKRQFQAGKEK